MPASGSSSRMKCGCVASARAISTRRRSPPDSAIAGARRRWVIEIQRIIGFLKSRGIGVLITDHNVRETLEIVDRAYILHEGRVLMEGRPSEIVADVDVRRVYLGERFSL